MKRKLLSGHYPSSKGKNPTYKVAFRPWIKIGTSWHLLWPQCLSKSCLKNCDSVSKQSRQDFSNPLVDSLECYKELWGGRGDAGLNFGASRSPNSTVEPHFLSFSSSIQREQQIKSFSGIVSIQVKVRPDGRLPLVPTPLPAQNSHTMTRSICRGRVEHLQLRNRHFMWKGNQEAWCRTLAMCEAEGEASHISFQATSSVMFTVVQEVLRKTGVLNSCVSSSFYFYH